jgi:hypothetical protein
VLVRQITLEKVDPFLAPVGDDVIILAITNGRAHYEKENLVQRMGHPPRISRIFNRPKMLKQRLKARRLKAFYTVHVHKSLANQPRLQRIRTPSRVKPR